ncbi:MAG: NUDIX domain-containing protein [bacterium]|nr:NUDIX domain-containing protein [bacterium]
MPKNGKKQTKKEFSAGGIVYQRSSRGSLIAFILDPYHKWGFAKGHIETNEQHEAAAIRETEEEMGIGGLRVIAPVGKTDIWFYERFRHGKRVQGPRALIHKTIYYYLMEARRGTRGKPQRSEHIRAIRWVPLKEAMVFCSYKNVRPILAKAISIIESREKMAAVKK